MQWMESLIHVSGSSIFHNVEFTRRYQISAGWLPERLPSIMPSQLLTEITSLISTMMMNIFPNGLKFW